MLNLKSKLLKDQYKALVFMWIVSNLLCLKWTRNLNQVYWSPENRLWRLVDHFPWWPIDQMQFENFFISGSNCSRFVINYPKPSFIALKHWCKIYEGKKLKRLYQFLLLVQMHVWRNWSETCGWLTICILVHSLLIYTVFFWSAAYYVN